MRRLHLLLLTWIVCVALGALSGCQKGLYGDVEGAVVDAQKGETVSDVDVWLDRTNIRARTDAGGVFRFKHVPVGVYALICSKPNSVYRETTIPNFRIRTDSVMRATVALDVKASLIYEDHKEPVALSSLRPEYGLFKGRYGLANDPKAPLTNLVLVHRDDKKLLSKFGGLHGSVAVASQDQALELVRLFTDLKTFFYFRERSPDNSYIEVRMTARTPGLGEIDSARARKLGILAPVVTGDQNGYTVTRYVMSLAQNLYRIKERVSFDGDYEITERSLIIPKMDIRVPAA